MIRQCFLANTGIQFHRDSFKAIGLDPNTLFPFVLPRPAPLKAIPTEVARLKACAHDTEPTNGALVGSVQASPTAASTFRTEEHEELADALGKIYDQLQLSRVWWILEVLPLKKKGVAQKPTPWRKSFQYAVHSLSHPLH